MVCDRQSCDYRFIRTSARKKKPETLTHSVGMSGAGGTHPVPIVACGVISVCRTHIVMAAGAFLFGHGLLRHTAFFDTVNTSCMQRTIQVRHRQ